MDEIYKNSIENKIISVLSAKASQEELTEIRQWLSESEGNRRLYDEIAAVWTASGSVRRHADYQPDVAWTMLSKRMKMLNNHTKQSIPLRKIMMVAAMMVVVFLAGMFVHHHSDQIPKDQPLPTYTEYSSPYGSKSKVKLPDGTLIWLNAGSIIRYSSDFNLANREVYLEGECYFDVTHQEKMPFWVQTSTVTIKVLGTAFNVKAYPEESFVETTVERGVVQLIDPLSSAQETTILRAQQKAVAMKAVQPEQKTREIVIQDSKLMEIKPKEYIPIANMEVTGNVKTEAYTSWKDTRWVIEREKLSSFAVKLERRYNVHFVFEDEKLKDEVFSAKLEDETLDQVLEAIKLTSPILYRVKQNTVYLNHNKAFK